MWSDCIAIKENEKKKSLKSSSQQQTVSYKMRANSCKESNLHKGNALKYKCKHIISKQSNSNHTVDLLNKEFINSKKFFETADQTTRKQSSNASRKDVIQSKKSSLSEPVPIASKSSTPDEIYFSKTSEVNRLMSGVTPSKLGTCKNSSNVSDRVAASKVNGSSPKATASTSHSSDPMLSSTQSINTPKSVCTPRGHKKCKFQESNSGNNMDVETQSLLNELTQFNERQVI